jgi:hypothetical protein
MSFSNDSVRTQAAAAAQATLQHCRGVGLEELPNAQLAELAGALRHGAEQAQATLELRKTAGVGAMV